MAIFKQEFQVGFRDTGTSNLLTNKGFLSYMEDIGGMHSDKVGLGINDIPITHLSWVLLAWKVHIYRRPSYGEKVLIKTWARHTDKLCTYRDFEVYDSNQNLLAIATSKWTLVNTQTRKITKITDDIISKYDPETTSVFPEIEISKLKEPEFSKTACQYQVLRFNIDINHHMHNLYYLDLAYEALPETVYLNSELNHIEIMYKKQITFHNTVNCNYTFANNQHIVTIKSEDNHDLHAIIKLY